MKEQQRAYRIDEFIARWPISRATVNRLIRSGELKRSKVGRRTLITAESAERWWTKAQALGA